MSALDLARAFGLHEVELPEPPGFGARIRLVEVDEVLRSRTSPPELRKKVLAMAEAEAGAKKAPAEAPSGEALPEGAAEMAIDLMEWQVATMVRALRPAPDAPWESVSLTPETFAELPSRTQAALRDINDRKKTPAMATALVRRMRGEISEEEALAVFAEERPKLISSWESFRDDGRSAGPGTDGAPVEPQPEQLHAKRRPRSRARAG